MSAWARRAGEWWLQRGSPLKQRGASCLVNCRLRRFCKTQTGPHGPRLEQATCISAALRHSVTCAAMRSSLRAVHLQVTRRWTAFAPGRWPSCPSSCSPEVSPLLGDVDVITGASSLGSAVAAASHFGGMLLLSLHSPMLDTLGMVPSDLVGNTLASVGVPLMSICVGIAMRRYRPSTSMWSSGAHWCTPR